MLVMNLQSGSRNQCGSIPLKLMAQRRPEFEAVRVFNDWAFGFSSGQAHEKWGVDLTGTVRQLRNVNGPQTDVFSLKLL